MYRLTKHLSITVWLLALTFLLAACPAPSAPQPLPTRTPVPTFTPAPIPPTPTLGASGNATEAQPADGGNTGQESVAQTDQGSTTNTESANTGAGNTEASNSGSTENSSQETVNEAPATNTPVPAPTATPVPQQAEVVVNSGMNIRGGPGTGYPILGSVNAGQRFSVKGKNNAGDWWQIDFNGRDGWVFAPLVTAQNTGSVALAVNIPPPPAPTAVPPTPVPPTAVPPTAAPAPQPAAPAPTPAPQYPFILIDEYVRCEPNAGTTYFSGFVRHKSNALRNAVCVHLAFYGPRKTKCSGCDGVGDGNWGFSPFGGPAPPGTTVEIFVVPCPSGPLPLGGQNGGFDNLTPQSPKWVHTVQASEQCTGITFVGD